MRPPRIDPGKVQARAYPGVFLGYDLEKRAYRVYVPHLREFIVSRDVKFDEAKRGYPCKATGLKESMSLFEDAEDSNFADEEDSFILPSPFDEEEEPRHEAPIVPIRETKEEEPPPLENETESEEEESEDEATLVPRRSGRALKPTLVGLESAANLCWSLLASKVSAKQAAADPNWRAAMNTEIQSLTDLGTFEVVARPADKKVITTRWVFQEKEAKKGKDRFKARLVAQGFKQVYGLDYDETWAPTARSNSIRLLVALSARDRSKLRLVDIKYAFLNAQLKKHQGWHPEAVQSF